MSKEIGGLVLIAIIAVVVVTMFVSQKVGEIKCNEIKTTFPSSPTTNCDLSEFANEYYNRSMESITIKYNEETYQLIDKGQIILPINSSTCSLITNEEEAKPIIIHGISYRRVQDFANTSYKDTCTCNEQSVGAGEICTFTQNVNSFIENQAIETAAKNDKSTLNIVRAVAPAGYKIKSIEGTKIILSAVKGLSGETFIGQSFEIVNTYTCALQTSGKRIYDYSNAGNQLLLQIKSGVFYYNSEDALININNDFKKLSTTNPSEMALNHATASFFNANTCKASSNVPAYQSNLDSITDTLEYAKTKGENETTTFINYITIRKNNATEFKLKTDKLMTEYELPNMVNAIVFLPTSYPYWNARLLYYDGNKRYEKGLYFSSIEKFKETEKQFLSWKITLLDQIISILLWSIIGVMFIITTIKHYKPKDKELPNA